MGSQSLLQRIFLTRGLNPGLLPCRQILYCLTANVMPVPLAGGVKTALISFIELFPDFSLGVSNKGYGFSSGHECMLDHKESWAPKNWCFWTVVLDKTLESPLDCKDLQPVNDKGNQFWIFTGRTDAEVEAPVLWLPDAKNWLIWKDPDAGKD